MDLSGTERTRHRRLREQGRTDRSALFDVLRAGFVCHLGVLVDGTPMNYRSAMVYGRPRPLAGREKEAALRVLSEHIAPGQWDYARRPSTKELAATSLLALSLDEASVKIAEGPPGDGDGPDARLGLWAGVLPLEMRRRPPVPDPALPAGLKVPAHIAALAGTDA